MHTDPAKSNRGDPAPLRLLVVEDDDEMRELLNEVLGMAGYDVVGVPNGAEALIRLRYDPFAAIVLDKNMPGLSGLDLLPGLRKMCPRVPVIMISAFGDMSSCVDAMEKGAFMFIFKPFRMEELLHVLRRALQWTARSQQVAHPSRTRAA